jgi:hypothetical protein
MMTAFDLVKQILFLLLLIAMHLLLGWQAVALVIAAGMGFIFERFIVTTAFVLGILMHTAGVLYNYTFYTVETEFLLQKAAIILGKWPVYLFPLLSVLLPSLVYALAAFFSIHLAVFIRTYKP